MGKLNYQRGETDIVGQFMLHIKCTTKQKKDINLQKKKIKEHMIVVLPWLLQCLEPSPSSIDKMK